MKFPPVVYANNFIVCIYMVALIVPLSLTLSVPAHVGMQVKPNLKYPLRIGGGPDCVANLSINVISDSTEFIICHLSFIFDTYIATTPDLLSAGNPLASVYKAYLFYPMQKLALVFLPAPLFIGITFQLILGSIDMRMDIDIFKYMENYIYNAIIIITMPTLFTLLIESNNAISNYILQTFSPLGITNASLSAVLAKTISLTNDLQSQFLPSLAGNLLYISLLIAVLFISTFFIIRFVLIWTLFLICPLLIGLAQLSVFKSIRDAVFMKIVQFMITQPVFLLGVGFFLIILDEPLDSLSKLILAIVSLFTLGFIPTLIAGLSGGKIASASAHKIQSASLRSAIAVRSVLSLVEEKVSEPYKMPYEKPDK